MNTPTPSDPDQRSALRRQLLASRQAWITSPQAVLAQTALEKNLLAVLRQLEPECLGLFWPLQGEFNPRPVALKVQKEGSCQLALPWAAKSPRDMHYRPWFGDELSTVDECGIPSPAGRPCEPDVLLVPCVGFTPEGWRLGYGGGYFDRYMAAHPEVLAIGVAWSAGELPPHVFQAQAHDVPLMGVVTETQVWGG